jgi:hypothetical protein
MTGAANKTVATSAAVSDFIAGIDHPVRRADAATLLALYAEVTGLDPVMWGPSIIGYGAYHYRYASGREGDMCRAGFSPRKANLAIYLMHGAADDAEMADLFARLGKHKMGASCLTIAKLADVDADALRGLIARDLALMDERYPR